MSNIYEGLLSLCSSKTQKIVSQYQNEFLEIQRLELESLKTGSKIEFYSYNSAFRDKHNLNHLSIKDLNESYLSLFEIEEGNLEIDINLRSEIILKYTSKLENNMYGTISFTKTIYNDLNFLSLEILKDIEVNDIVKKNKIYLLTLLLDRENKIKDTILKIKDTITIQSVFATKKSTGFNTGILNEMFYDINLYFGNSNNLKDVMCLKYDVTNDDQVLSIFNKTSESIEKNNQKVLRKIKKH